MKTDFGAEGGVARALQYNIPEDEEIKQRRLRFGHVNEPGEQLRRSYEWKGIDPVKHSFGAKGVDETESAKDALAWSAQQVQEDEGQRKRGRIAGSKDIPDKLGPHFTYGKTNESETESAEKLVHRWPEASRVADWTLGKSVRPGLRNTNDGARHDGSAFGVPSIRKDLKPFKRDSISRQGLREFDSAATTVFAKGRGAFEEDWMMPRTEEEMREIVQAAEMQISEQDFEDALKLLSEMGMKLSVESFRHALIEVNLRKTL